MDVEQEIIALKASLDNLHKETVAFATATCSFMDSVTKSQERLSKEMTDDMAAICNLASRMISLIPPKQKETEVMKEPVMYV
jgi:uncharacterized membrane-anchored protein YhcB (DUF1043 family)